MGEKLNPAELVLINQLLKTWAHVYLSLQIVDVTGNESQLVVFQ